MPQWVATRNFSRCALHKTINWCQCERVTQTMPGKREKGQRQVTKMLKVLKESTIEEAITSLMKKMPHYLQHVFVQRKQTRFFQEKFKTLMRKRQLFRLILQRITLAFNRMKFKQPAEVKNKWLSSPWWSGAKVVKTRPCVIPMPLYAIVSDDHSHEKKSVAVFMDEVLNTFVKEKILMFKKFTFSQTHHVRNLRTSIWSSFFTLFRRI